MFDRANIVKCLIDNGAILTVKDNYGTGQTPLEIAKLWNKLDSYEIISNALSQNPKSSLLTSDLKQNNISHTIARQDSTSSMPQYSRFHLPLEKTDTEYQSALNFIQW